MQSYQNVSNSQLVTTYDLAILCCKRLCKVIKMLAIHNYNIDVDSDCDVANAYAKLSKCQQFTTLVSLLSFVITLQTLMQSYQNVSNSQQGQQCSNRLYRCKRLCKVIKMLAIHNSKNNRYLLYAVANAYAKLSKCQQFTTSLCLSLLLQLLQTLMQSYQNVSNSQQT